MDVTLSGGNLGGTVVEWDTEDKEAVIDGLLYTLVEGTDQAVFSGVHVEDVKNV